MIEELIGGVLIGLGVFLLVIFIVCVGLAIYTKIDPEFGRSDYEENVRRHL